MFWTQDELSELQASAIPSKIGKDSADQMFRDHVISTIRNHSDVFFDTAEISSHPTDDQLLEQCHVMGSLIMSYAFEMQPDEDEDKEKPEAAHNGGQDDGDFLPGWVEDRSHPGTMGMVPMADMLNADAEFNAHLAHGEDSLTMTSLREIKAGEEVLNYYGPLPNGELLRRYGYTSSKHTRYDVVEIGWSLIREVLVEHKFEDCSSDSRREQILELLATIEADESIEVEDGFLLERECDDPSDEGTLTGEARFVKFSDEMVETITDVVGSVLKSNTKKRNLSDAAKQALLKYEALTIMEEIAMQKLKQYQTTEQTDVALLRNGQLPRRQTMAIEVRLGEKQLLAEAVNWTKEKKQKLNHLSNPNPAKRSKHR